MIEHRGKVSGVYLLYNKTNDHFYVGSSINIAQRMRSYFKLSYLKGKDHNMPILKALLKYGHANFALIIIEYTNIEYLANCETYWIKNLKRYYNILQQAYNSSGFVHNKTSKDIMRFKAKGRKHTNYVKSLISKSLKGIRNPFFNRKHSKITTELISIKKSKGLIYIYDDMLNLIVILFSLTNFKNIAKAWLL
jgi:group I intron endonuclease